MARAGAVNVASVGNVETQGANSTAISAQSIGGGGGNGGFSVAASIGVGGVGVGVGGNGSAGGAAGNVSVDSSGAVVTTGNNSIGILAQSIGGGGGDGGFSAAGSIGIAGAVSVGVGGKSGNGQNAQSASIYADGGGQNLDVGKFGSGWTLVTQGANSSGIVAQSLGGGGGNGGFAGTVALSGLASVGVSLGGKGGGGGNGGNALVESGYGRPNVNNILTLGDFSSGIIAQSIGGGGGNGGWAGSLSGAEGIGAVAVTLGGAGGNGGLGGNAAAYSIGNITTAGNMSDAVFAQSVGGSGGNGGMSVALSASAGLFGGAVAIGGSSAAGNDAGAVTLSSRGRNRHIRAAVERPVCTVRWRRRRQWRLRGLWGPWAWSRGGSVGRWLRRRGRQCLECQPHQCRRDFNFRQ